MKKKTGKALYAFLVIFALMLATTLFACGEERLNLYPKDPKRARIITIPTREIILSL